MKNIIKKGVKRVLYGPLSPIAAAMFQFISNLEYKHFDKVWKHTGWKKPKQEEIDSVCKKVTVIFKSFERK